MGERWKVGGGGRDRKGGKWHVERKKNWEVRIRTTGFTCAVYNVMKLE